MSDEPPSITQNEFNDLGIDLELPKCTTGLLGSRLQQWKLLDDSARIFASCFRQKDLAQFFNMEGNRMTYSDVDGVLIAINFNHSPEEWRLFVDSTN